MAKKAQTLARSKQLIPQPLIYLLLGFWSLLILWQTTVHFSWNWKSISLLFQWQRFGFFEFSAFLAQWLTVGKNILLLAAFMITSQAVGRVLLDTWFVANRSRLDKTLYAFGLGLSLISVAVFILGVLQILYTCIFAILLLSSTTWSVLWLWSRRHQFLPHPGWLVGKTDWADRALLLVAAGFLIPVGLLVVVPETFFDSLVYHLAIPNNWIHAHGIKRLPYIFFSNLPLHIEMLYTGALLLSDERLCRMLHAALGIMAGLAVFSLGRRWFGRRTGLWAAALFITTPVVNMNMLLSGVDVGATFFAILAFMALAEWSQGKEQAEQAEKAEPILAGLLIGAALACKYNTAFMLLPAVIVTARIRYGTEKAGKPILISIVKLSLAALIFLFPWFIKNLLFTGNPVYPFLFKIIPSENIHPNKMQQQMDGFREYGQRTWIQFLRQPWDLTFFMPTSNSYIGTAYLFLFPGIILLLFLWRRGPPVTKVFLATFLLALLIWSSQTRITRYLIPALPLAGVLGAWILYQTGKWSKPAGAMARATVIGLAFWGLLVTFSILIPHRDPVGVFLGLENRQKYLERKLMNSYIAMAEKVNKLPGKVKILLVGETRSYYFDKPVTAATVYDYNYFLESIAAAPDAETVWNAWREKGYTHIFMHYQEAVRTRGYEPYQWDEAALKRLQVLISCYLQKVAVHRQGQVLYAILNNPRLEQPVKQGRPLFTYNTDIVNKVVNHSNRLAAAVHAGQDQDARATWMRIMELAPKWHRPYVDLGWYYLRHQQEAEAFYLFQQADQLADLDADTYNNLGVHYLKQGNLAEAKRCLRSALEEKPGHQAAANNLLILEKTEQAQGAGK